MRKEKKRRYKRNRTAEKRRNGERGRKREGKKIRLTEK